MKQNDITLATCAMLVEFSSSCWTARKLDKKVTGEVTTSKSAHSDSARVNKNLFAGRAELTAITKHITKVRNYVYDMTLPWGPGQFLLPTAKFMVFDKQMNTYVQEFEELVRDFAQVYPTLVTVQAMAMGGMFSRDDYPPAGDIARRFAISYEFLPVPQQGDFRVDIGVKGNEALRERLEKMAKSREEAAMADLRERLSKHLKRMSEGLVTDTNAKTGEPEHRRFTSTLVTSAYDLCAMVREFNITHDHDLQTACHTLETVLAGTSAEGLRNDDIKRASVKKQVDSLLSTFGFEG